MNMSITNPFTSNLALIIRVRYEVSIVFSLTHLHLGTQTNSFSRSFRQIAFTKRGSVNSTDS